MSMTLSCAQKLALLGLGCPVSDFSITGRLSPTAAAP